MTKIVATLGPRSRFVNTISACLMPSTSSNFSLSAALSPLKNLFYFFFFAKLFYFMMQLLSFFQCLLSTGSAHISCIIILGSFNRLHSQFIS
jgi:hypothetical protein